MRTLLAILIASGTVILLGWVLWRWMRKSEDEPAKLIFKWGLSALLVVGLLRFALKAGDPITQVAGVLAAAVCGLILAILWVPNLTSWVARPFMTLYDGGDLEPVPQPIYGPAHARRKRGEYQAACEEIQKQLAAFPSDLEGHLLLAEIQAENLDDVDAASSTIWQWLSAQSQPQPGAVALALNRLADWQLHRAHQPEAARATLENVVRLFPESEQAQMAVQRIGHLPTLEAMEAREQRDPIHLPKPVRAGLVNEPRPAEDQGAGNSPLEVDDEIQPWLKRLESFADDHEAREQLVHLYLDKAGRPDLAMEQIRLLLETPSRPPRLVARWLNMAADVYVRSGDEAEARNVLQQVIDLGLESVSERARQRLARLKVEMNAQKKSQTVKLGSYEKNLGLKVRA